MGKAQLENWEESKPVASVNSREWFRPEAKAAALLSLKEMNELEAKLNILPGRPGCIDPVLEQCAALLGIDVKLFEAALTMSVSTLAWPSDSFHFDVLSTRSKPKKETLS